MPGDDGPAAGHDEAVQAEIGGAGEEAVGFIGDAAGPLRAAVGGHHVDHAGDRLAVLRAEAVGDQRRFGEDVRRDPQADLVGGGVELVLHAEAVEDERLLARPPAAIAGADGTRTQGECLLERADRQVPEVLGGVALLGAGGQRIERIGRTGLHREFLELDGARHHDDDQPGRLTGADDDVPDGGRLVPDAACLHRVVAAPHLPDAEVARRVGDGSAAGLLHRERHVATGRRPRSSRAPGRRWRHPGRRGRWPATPARIVRTPVARTRPSAAAHCRSKRNRLPDPSAISTRPLAESTGRLIDA